jgi:hypothetical protein
MKELLRSNLPVAAAVLAPVCAALLVAACATAPSARSPLREALATAGTSDVEVAVRTCLTQGGWKVDSVGSYSEGSNVVAGYKAKDQTEVYIHAADQQPRITGGPDDGNPFWKCLKGELTAAAASGDKDKNTKEKDSDDTPPASSAPSH